MLSKKAFLVAAICSPWIWAAPPIELRVSQETAPAGGVTQIKLSLSPSNPVGSGRIALSLDPTFFESIEDVGLLSPAGDAVGAAVIQGTQASLRFSSPVEAVGVVTTMPVVTIEARLKTGLTVGSTRPVTIAADAINLIDEFGRAFSVAVIPGSVTIGSNPFISEVSSLGNTVAIHGGGFTADASVEISGVTPTGTTFVNSTRMNVMLPAAVNLVGRRVRVSQTSGDAIWYPHPRQLVAQSASTRPLVAATRMTFSDRKYASRYFEIPFMNPGDFIGVAFQNSGTEAATVTIKMERTGAATQTATQVIAAGTSLVRDLSEILSQVAQGARIFIDSTAPIQMHSFRGDAVTIDPSALGISPAAPLRSNVESLQFNYGIGGVAPGSMGLNITSDGAPRSFTVTTDSPWLSTAIQHWLNTGTQQGTTPEWVWVTPNQAGLSTGLYTGIVTIASAGVPSVEAVVTLRVTNAAAFNLSPASVSWSFQQGSDVSLSRDVEVESTTVPFSYSIATSAPWLTTHPPVSGGAPGTLSIRANPASLNPGVYSGSVTLSAPGIANAVIPVTLTVTPPPAPQLVVSPTAIQLSHQSGNSGGPTSQLLISSSTGSGIPSYTVAANTVTGGNWLSIAGSGQVPDLANISANPAGLGPGVYSGAIIITASGVAAVTVPVTLTVTASAQQLTVNPTQLSITYYTGEPPPQATFAISSSSGAPLSYAVAVTPSVGWLALDQTTGTTPSQRTAIINASGLSPGTHATGLLVTAAGASPLAVPVVLNVIQGPRPAPGSGARFVPVPPCRIADTRLTVGPFGGPVMTAGSTRDFTVPSSVCGIPPGAAAYSLNATVVPSGPLAFLTLWPAGGARPVVSTLNAFDGSVTSNAAIVPAGAGGAISAFVTDRTDLILDINGYFTTSTHTETLVMYPVTPCRVADTRRANGPFGGPVMQGGSTRDFTVPASGCGAPGNAKAYSLNMTVVPAGPLSFLTTYPTGQSRPNVSTLNSFDASIKANAAIVPAGTNGAVSVFVTDRTDVIIDINGYFAPPGAGGMLFYPITPCRAVDTRSAPWGTIPPAGSTSHFSLSADHGACSIPTEATAFSTNITAVPAGGLAYLTVFPGGLPLPLASTLNSFSGRVTANAAIVPKGIPNSNNALISVFVTDPSHVLVDLNGYFAP